jgi:adenylyl-sulfate kinase
VDARHGVLRQTRRHAFIAALLGVPHLVLAVNKMDLVGFSEKAFGAIRREFTAFAGKLAIPDVRFIPISALAGDNVVARSRRMPWYRGEPLLEILENIYIASDDNLVDLRLPVQYVLRPDQHFRGYGGQVASGIIRRGEEVMVLPSRQITRVKSIRSPAGETDCAFPPQAVTLTLADELDISRGALLVHPHNVPTVANHFEAMLIWLNESRLDLNTSYFIKHTTQVTRTRIDEVRYKVNVDSLQRAAAAPLGLNEIGRVVFTATTPLFCDAYARNRATGNFILIDPLSNRTVAAGMIIDREPADRLPSRIAGKEQAAIGLARHASRITAGQRVRQWRQRPVTLWLTGLVGAGKTRLAYALEKKLFASGAIGLVLDGENIRLGLSRELDFSSAGRAEHLRRVAETARLANDAGQIVICAFTSPDAALRRQAAEIIGRERFLEIYLDVSAAWCARRDRTGLYARARSGAVKNLAGVNAPYDIPAQPALTLPMEKISIPAAVQRLLKLLQERGFFPARPD